MRSKVNKPYKQSTVEFQIEFFPDLAQDLYYWAVEQGYKIEVHELYYIIRDEEYRILYTRYSHVLQCYYLGFGHYAKESSIRNFRSLEEMIKYINKCRKMEINLDKTVKDTTTHQKRLE